MNFHTRFAGITLLVCCLTGSRPETPVTAAAEPSDSDRDSINLEALSRLKDIDLDANPAVRGVALKLLEQLRGTPQFVEIVRDFKIKDQEEGLIQIAAKQPSSHAAADSMRLVLEGGKVDLLKKALAGTNAIYLVEALGNSGEKSMVPLLEPIVTDSTRDGGLRKQTVRALAKVREGAAGLIELARQQELPEDLKLTTSTELNAVRWEDLKAEAAKALPPLQGHDSKPLPPISELIKMSGDSGHGMAVFRNETVGCSKCHQINGLGTDFGPSLSEIGTKLAKEALYEAILDPSAGISFGFEAWQLELKDGDEAYGLIVSETADEIALKAVGGVVTRYKKSDIAKKTKQKLSIMPAGLEKTMSLQELVDLVEYLSSLKKAAK